VFDVGGWEILVLVIAALFVFGPERLPQVTAQAVRALRQLRAMASGAREQLTDAIGPEIADLDVLKDLKDLNQLNSLRKLDPRAMITNALLDDSDPVRGNGSARTSRSDPTTQGDGTQQPAAPPTAYDSDAT
jgi:sec-independent protein translocase protein TatB